MTDSGCVVLGDVIESRDIANRESFRDTLNVALTRANESFESNLQTPLQVLKGIDEFGCVLETPARSYDLVKHLHGELFPYDIRVAAVYGEIDVGFGGTDLSEMDGRAFHEADAGLTRLADEDLLFWVSVDSSLEELVSMAANATLTIRSEWTDRQHEVVHTYERSSTQTDAAGELGIGQPAVSKTIRRVHLGRLHSIEEAISEVLGDFGPTVQARG